MDNKGALELSVNSIVILVIAFIVLGLILGFTRMIFKQATDLSDDAFGGIELNAEATASKPIAITDVSVKRGATQKMKVDVYNSGSNSVQKATLSFFECSYNSATDGLKKVTENIPKIEASYKPLDPSGHSGINVYLKVDSKALVGEYTCTIMAYEKADEAGNDLPPPTALNDARVFASESIFVTVTT